MRAGSRSAARAARRFRVRLFGCCCVIVRRVVGARAAARGDAPRARPPRAVHPPRASPATARRDLRPRAASQAATPAPGRRRHCSKTDGLRGGAPLGQESEAQRALRQLRLPGVHAVVRCGGGAAALGGAARLPEKTLTPSLLAGASGRRARPRCATPGACPVATRPLAGRGDHGGARPRRCRGTVSPRAHLVAAPNAALAPGAPPVCAAARADLTRDLRLARSGVCWGRKKKLPCRDGARGVSPLSYVEHEAPASPLRAEEPAPAAHELASADEAELELAGLLLAFSSAKAVAAPDRALGARQRAQRLARCVRRAARHAFGHGRERRTRAARRGASARRGGLRRRGEVLQESAVASAAPPRRTLRLGKRQPAALAAAARAGALGARARRCCAQAFRIFVPPLGLSNF